MSLRTILSSFVALALILGCIATVEATTLVSDDFNDDTGTLTGNVANTGQTWNEDYPTWVNGPMDTGTAFGQGGTVGAGYIDANHRGSYLPIPSLTRQTLMDLGGGSYTLSFDMNKGWAAEVGVELLDGGSGISVMWWTNKLLLGGAGDIWGIDDINPGIDHGTGTEYNSGYGGQIHVDFTIDVEPSGDSTATMSFYGIYGPDGIPFTGEDRPSGFLQGTTSSNFAYDGLTLWAAGNGSVPTGGEFTASFDNLSITVVPEPGMFAMLVIGLATLAFRRFRR